MAVLSVTELSGYLKALFDGDGLLADLWVEGEVSNCRPAGSGHWYWTLKDESAQLSCVMWKQDAWQQTCLPEDGRRLVLHGRVSVYPQTGRYQLYADVCQPAGMGELYLRFEALKAKLLAEGLFDAERKRPLPRFPMRIGVVTSPDAAALRDVCQVLGRRWPVAEVLLSPTLVQGSEAPAQIVAALEAVGRAGVDVVILCRGGGSIEDLWAFNDEAVARAVAAMPVPVVTGVGHETDTTIVDFVADLRAPTPSVAAERVSPDVVELRLAVDDVRERLAYVVQTRLAEQRTRLEYLAARLSRSAPTRRLAESRVRLDAAVLRLERAMSTALTLRRRALELRHARLMALDPQAILGRGYAHVIRLADGQTVRRLADVRAGTGLRVRVTDGSFEATVAGQTRLFE